MRKVVDAGCWIAEVEGLRVVDVSVISLPFAVYYQATVYVLMKTVDGIYV
jgi:hypothetical protein